MMPTSIKHHVWPTSFGSLTLLTLPTADISSTGVLVSGLLHTWASVAAGVWPRRLLASLRPAADRGGLPGVPFGRLLPAPTCSHEHHLQYAAHSCCWKCHTPHCLHHAARLMLMISA